MRLNAVPKPRLVTMLFFAWRKRIGKKFQIVIHLTILYCSAPWDNILFPAQGGRAAVAHPFILITWQEVVPAPRSRLQGKN